MEQQCRECEFDEATATMETVASALGEVASGVAAAIRAVDVDVARRRPAPGVWAPVEYLGHLRDAMAFHRWLIERITTEDCPIIEYVDPDTSVAAADYRAADIEDLIGQFGRRIDRLRAALASLSDEALSRRALLDEREVTVALVARSSWHECHHHLGDIRRIGRLDV